MKYNFKKIIKGHHKKSEGVYINKAVVVITPLILERLQTPKLVEVGIDIQNKAIKLIKVETGGWSIAKVRDGRNYFFSAKVIQEKLPQGYYKQDPENKNVFVKQDL